MWGDAFSTRSLLAARVWTTACLCRAGVWTRVGNPVARTIVRRYTTALLIFARLRIVHTVSSAAATGTAFAALEASERPLDVSGAAWAATAGVARSIWALSEQKRERVSSFWMRLRRFEQPQALREGAG